MRYLSRDKSNTGAALIALVPLFALVGLPAGCVFEPIEEFAPALTDPSDPKAPGFDRDCVAGDPADIVIAESSEADLFAAIEDVVQRAQTDWLDRLPGNCLNFSITFDATIQQIVQTPLDPFGVGCTLISDEIVAAALSAFIEANFPPRSLTAGCTEGEWCDFQQTVSRTFPVFSHGMAHRLRRIGHARYGPLQNRYLGDVRHHLQRIHRQLRAQLRR